VHDDGNSSPEDLSPAIFVAFLELEQSVSVVVLLYPIFSASQNEPCLNQKKTLYVS
jgi:hypothetical protein